MMPLAMPRHLVVWIDSQRAILAILEGNSSTSEQPLRSEPCPRMAGEDESMYRISACQYGGPQQLYDAVLYHLAPQDEILILGPGRPKFELRRKIEAYEGLKGKVVALRTASRIPQVELVTPTKPLWAFENVSTDQRGVRTEPPPLELPSGLSALR